MADGSQQPIPVDQLQAPQGLCPRCRGSGELARRHEHGSVSRDRMLDAPEFAHWLYRHSALPSFALHRHALATAFEQQIDPAVSGSIGVVAHSISQLAVHLCDEALEFLWS